MNASQVGLLNQPDWKPYVEPWDKTPGVVYLSGGHSRLPNLKEKVKVTMNGLGEGHVASYFLAAGFVGVEVDLIQPPAWYVKQNKGNPLARVFGAEFALLESLQENP